MEKPKQETKQEVIKHSAAIQMQNSITLLQRRAWNVLLAHAYDALLMEDEHHLRVQKLTQVLEFHSKNEDYLKEALEALVGCKVQWNVLDKDRECEWGVTTLLAQAKIQQGVCIYAYSPELRRRLHNPRMYARLSLSMQNKFESKHAQALWELSADYLGADRDYGETSFITIETFRMLMGIPESMYPAFMRLNDKVIKPAISEINRVSDFRVSVEYQRQGRKVTALKFKIRRVTLISEVITEQGNLFSDVTEVPAVVKELQEAGLSPHDTWELWQQGFRSVDKAARPVVSPEETDVAFIQYVREKIHLLKRRQALGKVEHSTGFLREALRHNYANPAYAQEQARQAADREQHAQHARARQAQALAQQKAAIEHARDAALQALYLQLAEEAPEVLEQTLSLLLQNNYLFRQFYQRDQSALANYQAHPLLQMGFQPALAAHAPAQVAAIEQHYTAQRTAVEAQLAALT